MLRKATAADVEELARLRGTAYREKPDQAAKWLQQIIGLDNVLVVETQRAGKRTIDAMVQRSRWNVADGAGFGSAVCLPART